MPYSPGYDVETRDDELIVTFNRSLVDREALVRLLDYIEIESIKQRSRLSESSARELESEIKEAAWKRTQHLFPVS